MAKANRCLLVTMSIECDKALIFKEEIVTPYLKLACYILLVRENGNRQANGVVEW